MSDAAAKIVITPAEVTQPHAAVIRIDPERPSLPQISISARVSPSPTRSPLMRWRMALGLLVTMAVLIAGFVHWQTPAGTDWIESVAATAERSVVQIRCGKAMGTGTVIAADGHRVLILTNKHVLAVANGKIPISPEKSLQCDVIFRSGNHAVGQLAGWAKNDNVDLALVVANTSDSPSVLEIASFASIRTGKHVVAIGHPLGLDFTVTDGIISAKREGLWLQTTAPINHGSSGGPIVDRSGRLLGINTMFVDEGRGPAYGFALRADHVTYRDAWHYCCDIENLLRQVQATHHEAP